MAPRNTTTVDLPFDLTDDEVRERGQEQSKLLAEKADVEIERKEKAKAFKDQIEDLDERIGNLVRVIQTGRELRPVSCEWVPDNARALMNLVRLDFGTVVQSRPMTDAEKQRAMFDVAGSPSVRRAMQDVRDSVPDGSSLSITTPDGQTTVVADKREASGE